MHRRSLGFAWRWRRIGDRRCGNVSSTGTVHAALVAEVPCVLMASNNSDGSSRGERESPRKAAAR
jgi:hypothetical protein